MAKVRIQPNPHERNVLNSEQIADKSPDIVLVQEQAVPRVDSRVIAAQLGKKHRSVYRLITDHQEDHETFGILRFEIAEIEGRGQPEKYALLNEDQCYLLLTHTRNTEQTRRLKVALVKAFGEARRAAAERLSKQVDPAWIEARRDTKRGHVLTAFALETTRARLGKATERHHYQNESLLIRFALQGNRDNLCRECMNSHELKVLARVEQLNARLIATGESYPMRKEKCRLYALQQLAELARRGRLSLPELAPRALEGMA